MTKEMGFTVDMRESTAKGIWKNPWEERAGKSRRGSKDRGPRAKSGGPSEGTKRRREHEAEKASLYRKEKGRRDVKPLGWRGLA